MTEAAAPAQTGVPAIRPFPGAAPEADPASTILGAGWRVTVLDDRLFRLELSDDGGFEDRASTFALRRTGSGARFDVERVGAGVVVTTDRARLRFDGGAPTATGLTVELLGADHAGTWHYGDDDGTLGGTARTLDGADGRVPLETGIVSTRGVAVIDDSASFLFEGDGWIGVREPNRIDLYLFAYGLDFSGAVRGFYGVSGPPALLPRWALGNWWSRYYPYSADDYLALMDRFREERTPFSVAVIDMDWHRVASVPDRFGSGWTGYSWERDLIPEPRRFLAGLHARGLRTTLNLHPADGVRAFEDAYENVARAVGIDPATEEAVPFDPTDRTFLSAYFEQLHHPLEADGVDFWWIDWQQGRTSGVTGVDPLWILNHFHYLDSARDGAAGMTFSRYAGPGSHRYAIGFSGDTVISWASLAFQPEFTATAANIGYGWWSHDIGGHLDGGRDDELETRWFQLGMLSPIMRLHSADNEFIVKEPWAFPAEHRAAMGDALRFRARLVPYLHTMNHRAAEGVPLVRPMYHEAPRSPAAYAVPNEFWFGSELIAAPVTTPRDPLSRLAATPAWLPEGTWVDIVTGDAYRGGRRVLLHRALEESPMLLRAGGILPLAGEDDLDATVNPASLEVLIAPGESGSFTLVEDDEAAGGRGTAHTPIVWDDEAAEVRIGPTTGRIEGVPSCRRWTVRVIGGPAPVDRTVTAAPHETAVVRFDVRPRIGRSPRARIRTLLEGAQTGYSLKTAVWSAIGRDDLTPTELVAHLVALSLPAALLDPLVELLSTVGDPAGD